MILDFLAKNALSIILFAGSLLIGYGYYKAKIEDLIKQGEKVDNIAEKIIALEKFQAVQLTTNEHHAKEWGEVIAWLKSLEAKLDRALER